MNRLESFSPRPAVAYALLVMSCALVASSTVLGRGVHEEVPPIGLAFWRTMVAVIVFAPLALPDIAKYEAVIRRHWRFICLLGILQIWPQAVMLLALNFTTAINALLINAVQPAVTALIAWILLRDRIGAGQIAGILLALTGMVVMTSRGDLGVLLDLDYNIGDLLVLIAVAMWALYAVKAPGLPREIGLATLMFLVSGSGAFLMLPFYIFETVYVRPLHFDAISMGTALYMGLTVSATAVFIWNMALRTVGSHRTSIFVNLVPVFGAVFAIIFLGERLFAYHLAGAVLVCIGITLVIRMSRRRSAASAAAEAEA